MDPVRTLLDWVDIPSVTGAEGDYGNALARTLAGIGLQVERQEVAPGRFNVLARAGTPEVVFCTHLDTVPPWIPPREDREFVHGRGACDAKGQAVAMIAAARALLDAGEDRFGMLFTVGEETDSAGAALANEQLSDPWRPRRVIVGEPTGLRWVRAHKGAFKAKLVAAGEAGHSSQAGFSSAIHALVRTSNRLLDEHWGDHAVLGSGTLNVGRIQGGVAANVVAASAEAEILVRVVEPADAVRARIVGCLETGVRLETPSKAHGPTEFEVPEGEEGIAVAFGTDAPHLPRWGKPMLFGPGSIVDAHTDHEKVGKRDLAEAALILERAVRSILLQRAKPATAGRNP
ncbi:MAG: M20/M25/M40 family metallo-hydrolase [Planctomycetota bacterium]